MKLPVHMVNTVMRIGQCAIADADNVICCVVPTGYDDALEIVRLLNQTHQQRLDAEETRLKWNAEAREAWLWAKNDKLKEYNEGRKIDAEPI